MGATSEDLAESWASLGTSWDHLSFKHHVVAGSDLKDLVETETM